MKFTSSQPSRAYYNPTIIYFTSASKNLTQFVKVLLVKLSDMLHSSNFVRLFHHQSFTLYGTISTTNVAPERDFEVLDRLFHEKPNAMSIALEAMILFSHNKTASWVKNKAAKAKNIYFR